MDEQIDISDKDRIFATGVFLQPVLCMVNNVNQWRWMAVDFEDDSYYDGKIINPIEYADNLKDMIADFS